jgi:tRNA-dihydrouridine synthase C
VRRAVPAHQPISAKMRLGYDDVHLARECAQAAQDGGACELVVHARTKAEGYRPPAHWEQIPAIREALRIPVIANGEIWNVHDAQRCREISGCGGLMLGRGIVADPGLALSIRALDGGHASAPPLPWQTLLPQIARFWRLVCEHLEPRQRAGRLKQWLNLLRRRHVQAEAAFEQVRVMTSQQAVSAWVERACAARH